MNPRLVLRNFIKWNVHRLIGHPVFRQFHLKGALFAKDSYFCNKTSPKAVSIQPATPVKGFQFGDVEVQFLFTAKRIGRHLSRLSSM